MVAATAVAIGAKRANVPYNVALVVGGLLLAVSDLLPAVPTLTPDVVFLICLPILLFEGGIAADLGGIRSNATPITLLATVGMVLAVVATGALIRLALDLPWGPALLLGCILAVTDTVSILFAFRRAKVPPRLAGIAMGESLFNDGTALVLYAALAAIVAGGASPSIGALGAKVLLASAGGAVMGLALGFVASFVLPRIQDPLAEIMATTAVAFGAFVGAEQLHLSGAIAAVVAGLTVGAASKRTLPPTSQVALHSFWEYVAFGVNTFLFLFVGLSTNLRSLLEHLPLTLVAGACMFGGRAVAIYLPFTVLGLLRPSEKVPLRWQHVFVIGNIKGALSIALVLGLPENTPHRAMIVDIAFGVTFISLLVQGLSLGAMLRKLGLVESDPVAEAVTTQQARIIAARAARQELETLHDSGLVPRMGYEHLRSEYQVVIASAERELRGLNNKYIEQGARVLLTVRRRLIDAERTALIGAFRAGLLSEVAAERFLHDLDERTLEIEQALSGHGGEGEAKK